MALCFSPSDTPLHDLQVWHAESDGYSFVISHERQSKQRFIASWRPRHTSRLGVALEGSPFATFEDAEQACELMLVYLSADK